MIVLEVQFSDGPIELMTCWDLWRRMGKPEKMIVNQAFEDKYDVQVISLEIV